MKKLKIPKPAEIKAYFLNHRLTHSTLDWSKSHSFPGFSGIPIYNVTEFVIKEVQRVDVFTRANSMAYSFFLSLFPSLISLFTLLPYLRKYILRFLPHEEGANFRDILAMEIQEFLPGNAGFEITKFIEDLTTNPRVGLLSFGFILALFFSSNGMLTMMRGFEKSYPAFKKRTALKKRLVAIFLTAQLGFLLIASVVLIILGNFIIRWLSDYIHLDRFTELSIYFIRWVVIILLFYSVISIIYRFGVAVKKKFKLLTPGATLASILSIIASIIFSFYVDNFSQYNKLYGSFGTIIVTMIWIQLNCMVLLLGFELNASIAVNKDLLLTQEEEKDS